MKFFNLLNECKFEKNISKELIYNESEADEKLKRIFIENVEKIILSYLLTNKNTNIAEYVNGEEKYKEINFIEIILRNKGKENIISKLLHELIPKGTLVVLKFENEFLISGVRKRITNNKVILDEIYNSRWINEEDEHLKEFDYKKLDSTNLKLFYENIIEKIRLLNLNENLDSNKNIKSEDIDKIEKLNKEIEELKKERKKETQINRVAEIQGKLLEKIKERDRILNKN
ncbi:MULTISPECIES: DUF4391 domain-containing protein [Fusobacterium]|uniref:DUF4391 domain-containing protein n=1 Tax=Fusobacterium TaxID=848 RepID=UPI001476A09B|nr:MULTISPECIES: DUF4391 domain-containing protein [Fusobacterium]NME35324.1 DUF4391 domain-containing protein [Fusobacterium sp. FSA-380-WT-3A]